jgi:hypothetical protein
MSTKLRKRLTLQALESREVPAGDLLYALQLNGLSPDAFTRTAADAIGNNYITGTFSGTVDLDPSATKAFNVTSKGGTDVFVAKYGTSGQLIWARTLGGTGNDSAADISFDTAGNVYTVGTFNGTVDFNPASAITANITSATGGSAFVWKLDFNGNLFLARSVAGTSTASAIATDSRGNMVVTGSFTGTADFNPLPNLTNNLVGGSGDNAFIWRLDTGGSASWAKAISSAGKLDTTAIALDGAGNVYTGGRFTNVADFNPHATTQYYLNGGAGYTPFIQKLDINGNFLWTKAAFSSTPSDTDTNGITGLVIDSLSNVYAAGTFTGTVDFNPNTTLTQVANLTSVEGSVDAFVWKLDTAGTYRWGKQLGGMNDETVTDLAIDKAGNTYTIGTFTGTGDFDPGTGVAKLISGSGTDSYVVRLNTTGNMTYARSFGGGTSSVLAKSIWADGVGNFYISGGVIGKADLDPSAEIKTVDGGTSGKGFLAKVFIPANSTPNPSNPPPTAVSAGGPYIINEGGTLVLKGAATDSKNDTLTYSWDLNGDGVYDDATGSTATVTWARLQALGVGDNRGTSTIRLKVTDSAKQSVIAASTLTINNVAPIAKLRGFSSGLEGLISQVGFTAPSDPSQSDAKAGFRYSYDFNNDGVWDYGTGTSWGGSRLDRVVNVPAKYLSDNGLVTVKARVFDKDGDFSESFVTIRVVNVPPRAIFTAMTPTILAGNIATVKFTAATDQSPQDRVAGYTYSFDFNNDGTFEKVGTSATAHHTFAKAGTYTVRGRIADKDGGFRDYYQTIRVI